MVTKRSLNSWVLEKNGRWQLLIVLLVVGTVAIRVVPLEMQKRIVNQAIGRGDMELLVLYCLLFVGSTLLSSTLKFCINLLQAYIGQHTLLRMRITLHEHILSLPLSFFRTIQPGQVINALINELASVSGYIGSAVSVPLINVCTLLAMGGYLFYLNPLLAGMSFVIYPLQIVVVPRLQKRANEANRYRVQISRAISGSIGEVITGVHEVHGHAGFALENEKFASQARHLLKANVRMNAYRYGIKFANNFFEHLGPFLLFLVGGAMTIRGHFDLGALVAFLSAYASLSDPWRELMDFYQLREDSRVRYSNVMAAFDLTPDHLLVPVGRDVHRLRGDIDLEGVAFRTPEGARIIEGVNLSIRAGEMVALVGFSGSGKSTLVKVIAQLMPYTGGRARIDGHEVHELTKLDVAENLGMVPQHPFIFSGTVRENLLYSSSASAANRVPGFMPPDLDRIIEVVQQVGLFLDILKFGSQANITPEEHPELVERVLQMRRLFRERYEVQFAEDIEFFDQRRYLNYGSILKNIVFGDFIERRARLEDALSDRHFIEFLEHSGLDRILVDFGAIVAVATVPILRYGAQTPELYAESPISRDDVDSYAQIVSEMGARGQGSLSKASHNLLLRLALKFESGRHKTVRMPEQLKDRILGARSEFRDFIKDMEDLRLRYLEPTRYLESYSIRENILFGQPKSGRSGTLERINQHLVQLLIEEGVLERIVELGLEFQVGSMGEYLSGGQRQKVALARVFLKQPAVYVLDEATAALDNASQARVQNFLRTVRGKHTVISVVHRLDTVSHYDRIVVMKAGKIVESGPYDELMAAKGVLHGLVGTV
ncbi:MAG: ABC transporter ATP-binding protein [Deltaproteobacteria bacterium HGW-Deltaproteobacteria-18]|nr:MAG: ABC transporter ATP-binding protein [Deltaproteobacteria bacterium HGW-Deltaproteobacteria-18]